ncbi:unnamed protein product, partial [Mesorhabditis belari]|uniref:Uncharacterized protein n=1 Tax=Mesorhabditis belari TaxID=2138241 RepID=A0AAF3FDZ3_9BILA
MKALLVSLLFGISLCFEDDVNCERSQASSPVECLEKFSKEIAGEALDEQLTKAERTCLYYPEATKSCPCSKRFVMDWLLIHCEGPRPNQKYNHLMQLEEKVGNLRKVERDCFMEAQIDDSVELDLETRCNVFLKGMSCVAEHLDAAAKEMWSSEEGNIPDQQFFKAGYALQAKYITHDCSTTIFATFKQEFINERFVY